MRRGTGGGGARNRAGAEGWRILNLGIPFETGIKIEKIRFSNSGPYSGPPLGTPWGSILEPFWSPCWTLWGLWGLQVDPFGHFWGRDGNLGDDGKRNGVYGMEMDVDLHCFLERRY